MLPNLLDQPDRHSPVSAPSGHRRMAEHPFLTVPVVLPCPSSPAQHSSPLPSMGCSHWRAAALTTSSIRLQRHHLGFTGVLHKEKQSGAKAEHPASLSKLDLGLETQLLPEATSLRCFYPRDPAGEAFPRMGIACMSSPTWEAANPHAAHGGWGKHWPRGGGIPKPSRGMKGRWTTD